MPDWIVADEKGEWWHNAARQLCYHVSGAYYRQNVAGELEFSCFQKVRVTTAAKFMQGRRPKQEDRHVLIDDLCQVGVSEGLAFDDGDLETFPCSYYALFDGHSGSHASDYCSRRLHVCFIEHLSKATSLAVSTTQECSNGTSETDFAPSEAGVCTSQGSMHTEAQMETTESNSEFVIESRKRRKPVDSSSSEADETQDIKAVKEKDRHSETVPTDSTASKSPEEARESDEALSSQDSMIMTCITAAFEDTDKEFLKKYRLKQDGCTAVAAFFFGTSVYFASVGDSRAVLGKRDSHGKLVAVAMSSDHKPSRPDERRRIEKSGGRVMTFGGVPRVATADYEERCRLIKKTQCMQGVAAQRPPVALAVSRAFGDKELKEPGLVISTPEITKLALTPECEVLVMACDGIWDVLTNQEVVELTKRHPHQPEEAASAIVTSAFKNGSQDNLTVVVMFVSSV